MERRLLLYNPENDIALANNALSYTPTRAVRAMRYGGSLLPLWWSEPGDELIVPEELMGKAQEMCRRWNLPCEPVTASSAFTAMPWGWSRSARRELQAAGVSHLPTDEELEAMRNLSHRRTSIELLRALGADKRLMPQEFDDPQQALQAIDSMERGAVVKMPWSGSGRGVFHSLEISRAMLEKTVRDVIQAQGSIIVEHELGRERDLATLFYSDGERVEYRGLSLFIADKHGHYQGNVLASEERLQEMLGYDIEPLAQRIASWLSPRVAPVYKGWLGVDMMVHNTLGKSEVWPCIEINLRLTMGVLAHCLHKRLGDRYSRLWVVKGAALEDALSLSPADAEISIIVE